MSASTTLKSLKSRYEEALANGDRVDRGSKLPSIPFGDKANNGTNDGFFLTQKANIRNQARKEIEDLEQLLSAATQTSQSTLLLKKRKEVKEVDDALDLMKKDHKKRMDACEERRIQFELKQAKLREQVLKFEKFIQENDLKRQRAESKAKYERKQYEEKCKEILHLTSTIQELENSCQLLQKQLSKEKRYEEYLEKITDQGDYGYEEIPDILNRHRTLIGANQDLMVQSGEREKDLDQLRATLHALKIEKQNQLLVSNSSIQVYQNRLEQMRSAVKEEEEEKYHMEDKQKNVSKELSQVMLAVKNIYNRCIVTMNTVKPTLTSSSAVGILSGSSSSSGGGNFLNSSNGMMMMLGSTGTSQLNGTSTNLGNSTISNKNLIQLSEKLDQSLILVHARMIDLIDIIREFPSSGYVSVSNNVNSGLHSTGISSGSGVLPQQSSIIRDNSTVIGNNSSNLKEMSASTVSNHQSRSQYF